MIAFSIKPPTDIFFHNCIMKKVCRNVVYWSVLMLSSLPCFPTFLLSWYPYTLLYTFLITCLHHFLAFCCLKSQQKAISSVVEPCLGRHVSVLCTRVHKNGVPSKAIVQNVLRVLCEITWKLWNATGWCTAHTNSMIATSCVEECPAQVCHRTYYSGACH